MLNYIVSVLWAAWLRPQHPGFITVPVLLIDCVSVAVAFIPGEINTSLYCRLLSFTLPEGLPVCVTLSLTVM